LRLKFILLQLLLFSFLYAEPSNSVHIDLLEAEKLFYQNNLLLLAARFKVDLNKAKVEQAGLYSNPNIFIDQSIYAEPTQRWFDTTRNGQTAFQIQQLFLMGGKIDKRIKVAELGSKISEQEFFDLSRSLTTNLRRLFYAIHFNHKAIAFYDASIESLEKTVSSSEMAYQRRAILHAELLRIKALLFFLKRERESLQVQILEKEAEIKVLLNDEKLSNPETRLFPEIDSKKIEDIQVNRVDLKNLLIIARENRPDLKIALNNLKYEEANLDLQHANAIPDLAVGPSYNRAGTAFQNYWGMTVQLTVPIFDRNQGNIKAAEKSIQSKKKELSNKILEVENEVAVAYYSAKSKDDLFKKFNNTYTEEYKNLSKDMVFSYEKKYITILEFADFFETYRNSIVEILKLQIDRMEAIENVNYSVGKVILSPNLTKSQNIED
jgi:cobalt-zinc-cadmium efflux system outer membrane protein